MKKILWLGLLSVLFMLFIAFQSSADPLPVNFDITYVSNEGGLL